MNFKDLCLENKFIILMAISIGMDSMGLISNPLLALIIFGSIVSMAMDKMGHILQLISINKLSSRLERSDFKLKQSEQRFRDFFTQTHIPMCIFDLRSRKFLSVNKTLCDILEYSEDILLEMPLDELIVKEDLEESMRVVELNIKMQKLDSYTNRYKTKSGKIIPINWTFTKSDEDGISYCVGMPV